MSDAPNAGGTNPEPLFQNMDEQERVFAPQQIPGAVPTADEVDVGASAGAASSGAAASDDQLVAGADGNEHTTPVVAVRPDPSIATPLVAPVNPGSARPADERDTTARER